MKLQPGAFVAVVATLIVSGFGNLASADVPAITLIGDSTVTDDKGWGAAFANALKGRAVVDNHAVGGRSARSFADENRLAAALRQSPDYVFIQFGHSGQPGKGPHRETDPNGSYRDYLRAYVADIRAAGAEPVIVSSLTRRKFDNAGSLRPTLGPWAKGARAVADELDVAFVNLFSRSVAYHRRIGRWRSKEFDVAPGDHTHLDSFGGNIVTGMIFDALAEIDHPLAELRPMTVRVGNNAVAGKIPTVATITEALGLAPTSDNGPFRIHLGEGRFEEKLLIEKPHVHLLGTSRKNTIVSWSDSGDSAGLDGRPVGTRGSWSVKITAPGFSARQLTFENAFDYESNRALPDDDPARVHNAQGVALMLSKGSDRARFEDVAILGHQDTLFVDAGRSYFRNVRIVGHVDFIFGAGQAVFENTSIEALNRPGKFPVAYVTAPSTHISQPFGMLFVDCRIVRHGPSVPSGSVKLGRPWHPGGDPEVNGSAVFLNCFMDDSLAEDGYEKISSTVDGVRKWFDLEPDSRFFEYGSHGPGALTGPRRPQLSAAAARYYTIANVLAGWDPHAQTW